MTCPTTQQLPASYTLLFDFPCSSLNTGVSELTFLNDLTLFLIIIISLPKIFNVTKPLKILVTEYQPLKILVTGFMSASTRFLYFNTMTFIEMIHSCYEQSSSANYKESKNVTKKISPPVTFLLSMHYKQTVVCQEWQHAIFFFLNKALCPEFNKRKNNRIAKY